MYVPAGVVKDEGCGQLGVIGPKKLPAQTSEDDRIMYMRKRVIPIRVAYLPVSVQYENPVSPFNMPAVVCAKVLRRLVHDPRHLLSNHPDKYFYLV